MKDKQTHYHIDTLPVNPVPILISACKCEFYPKDKYITRDLNKVTCKNCKRTIIFKEDYKNIDKQLSYCNRTYK